VSDEPLYCAACGREDCACDQDADGLYCQACGVIPAPGKECKFYKEGGLEKRCETGEGSS
jgi:hypothetical protein